MSNTGLRLESFATGFGQRALPTVADIEHARQEGYQQGVHDAVAARLDRLCDELRRACALQAELDRETARVRQATLEEVAPLLDLVIEMLGPEHIRSALIDHIGRELQTLREPETRGPIRIICTPDLAELVRQCVHHAQSDAVVEAVPAAESSVEICAQTRRLRFEPDRMLAGFRNLIQELAREE